MKIASFAKNASTGAFDFTVAIEDVSVGSGATAANLATLFGIEGCAAVDGTYSADNVTFTFGTPVDGKVTLSATPVDTTFTRTTSCFVLQACGVVVGIELFRKPDN